MLQKALKAKQYSFPIYIMHRGAKQQSSDIEYINIYNHLQFPIGGFPRI